MFGSKPCAIARELVAANSAVASAIFVLSNIVVTPRVVSLLLLKSCSSRLLRRGLAPRRCTQAMDTSADFQSRDAARDHVFPEQVVIGAIGGAISYNSAQARTKFPARARERNAFIVDIGRFFEP